MHACVLAVELISARLSTGLSTGKNQPQVFRALSWSRASRQARAQIRAVLTHALPPFLPPSLVCSLCASASSPPSLAPPSAGVYGRRRWWRRRRVQVSDPSGVDSTARSRSRDRERRQRGGGAGRGWVGWGGWGGGVVDFNGLGAVECQARCALIGCRNPLGIDSTVRSRSPPPDSLRRAPTICNRRSPSASGQWR